MAENTATKSLENVTKRKCVLADRRGTSLRQQANQLTPEHFERAGTSKSSEHHKRENYCLESLKAAESKLTSVDAWQLCYDGKIIDGIDRYVFVTLDTTASGYADFGIVLHLKISLSFDVLCLSLFAFICQHFWPSILNLRLLKVLQLCCLREICYLLIMLFGNTSSIVHPSGEVRKM